jgi:hypothetical protein
MDFETIILTAVLSFPLGLLGTLFGIWVGKKTLFSRQNIMESVDSVLEYALNTVEGQMKVKAVLEKVAEGLMKGTGMRGSGRKPNLQDIVIQLGLQYAQSKGWLGTSSDGAQNQQEQSKKPWERQ